MYQVEGCSPKYFFQPCYPKQESFLQFIICYDCYGLAI